MPEVGLTVATKTLLLLQRPPLTALVNNVGASKQTLELPETAAGGELTDTNVVTKQAGNE
jgi:hypothetical protein